MKKICFRISVLVIAISLVTPLLAENGESILDKVKKRGPTDMWGEQRIARFRLPRSGW